MAAELRIQLNAPHPGQQRVINGAKRFNVLRCGRRWGKTIFGENRVVEPALAGKPTAWFAPTYKYLDQVWDDINRSLAPVIAKSNQTKGRIDLKTGGVIDFWTMEHEDPGRGRKYARVVIDEAGIVRNFENVWQASIRPTLTDYRGGADFLGTPKGCLHYFSQLFSMPDTDPEWTAWQLPTIDNPYIPADEVEAARKSMPPNVFNQEYLGIPADDGGNPFGLEAIRACVVDGLSTAEPVVYGVDLAKSRDWTVSVGMDADGAVCRLDRWQSDWGQTKRRLLDLVASVPTLMDSTGNGDPIVEDLQRTGGGGVNIDGFRFSAPSKQQLMEGLAAAIQRREIRIPDGWLVRELESFQYEYRPGGVRYSAPEGMHDDGVCALALAVQHRTQAAPLCGGVIVD